MANELDLHRRIRWYTQWLVLSLVGNAALLTALVWLSWSHRSDSLVLTLNPKAHPAQPTLGQALHQLNALNWDQLVNKLKDPTPLEFGFSQRDVALSRLVDHFGLDLARALGRWPQQQRAAQLGSMSMTLFPGLDDAAYQRITRLIESERFPLTAAGCIRWLRDRPDLDARDRKDLLVCLGHSDAWRLVEELFQSVPPARTRVQLVDLAIEADWKPFASFWDHQRHARDLSVEQRFGLLTECMEAGSSLAARWLMEEGSQWAQKRLTDPQLLQMISLREVDPGALKPLLRTILASPRSDGIRQFAAQRLYALDGEEPPQPMSLSAALERYCPEVAPAFAAHCAPKHVATTAPVRGVMAAAPAQPTPIPAAKQQERPQKPSKKNLRVIQVRAGDTLQKIAKKYGVSVAEIRKLNEMHSDKLTSGSTLLLPAKS